MRELRKKGDKESVLKKYAALGEMFTDMKGKDDSFYIDGFINYLHTITDGLKLPGLKHFGIEKNDVKTICDKTDIKNNPVKLSVTDLAEILYRHL